MSDKPQLISITKSDKAGKKMTAVFMVGKREKTIHFGATGYNDYTIYYSNDGKEKADKMRNAYIARHSKLSNFNDPLTASSLSRYVLWEAPTVSGGISAYKKRFGF
jgi:hypothetical protein